MVLRGAAGGTPQETGFTLVGAGASVNTGGTAWNTPGNITAEDSTVTIANCGSSGGGTVTDTLRGSSLGFAIPGDVSIAGIELRIRGRYTAGPGTTTPNINSVNIGKDNSTLGTAKSPATAMTESLANYTYGSSTDLWGLSWTPAEINASTFQGLMDFAHSGLICEFGIDTMWINIHYTT